ncbi:YceI family protein [Pseudoxanthomonas mexicana]|uniref:YceI family protein n=1 Tax=Pseudoxanthomonas mexicana TaxID=128785 RepID=UPI00398A52AA
MTPIARRGWLGLGGMLLCAPCAWAGGDFDPAHTRLGFQLSTRWGQKLEGVFPTYEGQVSRLPDGRQQVLLRMFTGEVEILDHPRYTQWARGEKFFESARWPQVVFTSRPYEPELLAQGGKLPGNLVIRGISRPETLVVAPAGCARPAYDCDVVATGTVRRSDFDMDDWKLAVNDRVVFVLRARVKETDTE